MRKRIAIAGAIALLAVLACSLSTSAATGDVWLGGYFLLRIRTAAGGFTVDQRVEALQARANNLLKESETVPAVTLKRSGSDVSIYANGNLFITVTAQDARANGTTTEALAAKWAERLRSLLPRAVPIKPGVGRPGD